MPKADCVKPSSLPSSTIYSVAQALLPVLFSVAYNTMLLPVLLYIARNTSLPPNATQYTRKFPPTTHPSPLPAAPSLPTISFGFPRASITICGLRNRSYARPSSLPRPEKAQPHCVRELNRELKKRRTTVL